MQEKRIQEEEIKKEGDYENVAKFIIGLREMVNKEVLIPNGTTIYFGENLKFYYENGEANLYVRDKSTNEWITWQMNASFTTYFLEELPFEKRKQIIEGISESLKENPQIAEALFQSEGSFFAFVKNAKKNNIKVTVNDRNISFPTLKLFAKFVKRNFKNDWTEATIFSPVLIPANLLMAMAHKIEGTIKSLWNKVNPRQLTEKLERTYDKDLNSVFRILRQKTQTKSVLTR